jgi:precorrin-2/cobalt-factor-2 C20-methyltransferase
VSGRLYGLGVGPGDPELLTLKAHRILQTVPVIAYPAPDDAASLVRAIADPHIPPGRTEIVIRTPMVPGRFPAHDVYDHFAREIGGHLDAGHDVAVLCEGDPLFYGSFMYLFERLAGSYPTEVVPGVSSLTACAAVAGLPLASRNQCLIVVPAPLAEDDLVARLEAAEAAAVIKVGRHLAKVRHVLERLGRVESARYVSRATMADAVVCPLSEIEANSAPYFSMILVPPREGVT